MEGMAPWAERVMGSCTFRPRFSGGVQADDSRRGSAWTELLTGSPGINPVPDNMDDAIWKRGFSQRHAFTDDFNPFQFADQVAPLRMAGIDAKQVGKADTGRTNQVCIGIARFQVELGFGRATSVAPREGAMHAEHITLNTTQRGF